MKDRMTIVLLMTVFVCTCSTLRGQSISGQVNSYFAVSALSTTANSVTVDDATGLTAGDRVLLYQAKGATIDGSQGSTFGSITAVNSAGLYEFNTICSITGNVVTLKAPFLNTYQVTGKMQLVSVASYTSVTVSGQVTAAAWDPTTGKGGIVVIEASGTISLNADINVSGQGFLGGALVNYPTPTFDCNWYTTVNQYYLALQTSGNVSAGKKGEGIADYITGKEYAMGRQASGGGGGNNANSGGAGGANYGAGGAGGQRSGEGTYNCHGKYPGIGGLALSSYGYGTGVGMNRIFPGSGGGSGHENDGVGEPGGNGGGIILLTAAAINGGGGKLIASGLAPTNSACQDPYQAEGDGGGGGGAGGVIILNSPSITGSIQADVTGAAGSNSSNRVNDCTGPGGGGGGGVIWAAGSSLPTAVSYSVTGGTNGVVSPGNTLASCRGQANGATSGATGASIVGYVAPESTGNVCVPLDIDGLVSFTGRPHGNDFVLSWTLQKPIAEGTFTIERSTDGRHFSRLVYMAADAGLSSYNYTDSAATGGSLYYRLAWQAATGAIHYSRIIAWTSPGQGSTNLLRVYPNPASTTISVEVYAAYGQTATWHVYSAQGQKLFSKDILLHAGLNTLTMPVGELAAGVYFGVLETGDGRLVKPFTKR